MENVCRICLCSPNQLQPLFDGTQLNEKIRIISSVVMEENDGFPNSVCADCIINVNTCYNFRLVVINSDVELRQRGTESSKLIIIDQETAFLTSELIIKREESDLEQIDHEEGREVAEEWMIKVEEVESDKPEIKIYECQKCGFITQDLKLFQKHYNSHKKTKSQTDICKVENDELEIRTYVCMKCDFVTENLKLYRKHNHLEKPKTQCRRRLCSICGKMIKSICMATHMKSHETTPAECDICGKIYKNVESLRNHKTSHQAPNICEYCGRSYSHRANYYVHVKRHHKGGMKEYNCSRCDKVFSRTDKLKRHMQAHTGERPHICEFCQKGFSSTDALKTHKRQHTNEKPYKCKLCSANPFKQRVLLRNHLKAKHPGQEYSF